MPAVIIVVIVLAGLALVLGALTYYFRRRWMAAEAAAAYQASRAAALETRLSAAPLGCLALAPDGEEVHGAATVMAALGLGAGRAVGLSALLGAFTEDGAERLATAIDALRGAGTGFEEQLRRKDGQRVFAVTLEERHE